MNVCLLCNYVDNGIYDAGIFEEYPAEEYHSESDPPSPKVRFPSDTASTKGM